MKKITVNFRLNSTGKNTFPVQILVNLGGLKNDQGKKIVIVKNIGLTLKREDWNTGRRLPKSNVLANRLLQIEQKVKGLFDVYKHQPPTNFDLDLIKDQMDNIIDGIIKNKPIRDAVLDYVVGSPSTSEYNSTWINRLKDFNFKIIDSKGRKISPEKFFDVYYNKDYVEQMVENFEDELNVIEKESEITSENDNLKNKVDNYPIVFSEYIRIVADLKSKQIKDRLTDQREYLKLAKKFEVYDSTLTLGQYNDKVGEDFLNWIKTTDKFNIKSVNSFGSIIKVLKSVLIYATQIDEHNFGGYPAKLDFVNVKKDMYSKQTEDVDNVYVNEQMLKQLNNLDLSENDNPQLGYVRDLFIIGSYTASRFGDLSQMFNVQKYKNKDVYYIEYRDNKEGERGQIPVPNFVYEIIKKYDYKFQKIDNAVFNKLIKLVFQIAGWNEDYHFSQTNLITNKTQPLSLPFSQMVSSHTMRRSFATNMYHHRKLDKRLVMNFTHHKTEDVFDNYIKTKQLQYVDEFIDKFIVEVNS